MPILPTSLRPWKILHTQLQLQGQELRVQQKKTFSRSTLMTFHCQGEINREAPLSQESDLPIRMGMMMMTIRMKAILARRMTPSRTLNQTQALQRPIPRNLAGDLILSLLSSNRGLKHDLNVRVFPANRRLQPR